MKNMITLCLFLVLFSVHSGAQQRNRTTGQRRGTTMVVKKPVQPTIEKKRCVGKDGFIWYQLKKGNFYGAADIEGKTIIPIMYDNVRYVDFLDDLHYFEVDEGDFEGLYTRMGTCIIPTSKHFTCLYIKCSKNDAGKVFLGVECKNNNGQCAFYDVRGNEVIAPMDMIYYLLVGLILCTSKLIKMI